MHLNINAMKLVPTLQDFCAITVASQLLLKDELRPDVSRKSHMYEAARTRIMSLRYPSLLKTVLLNQTHYVNENINWWLTSFDLGIKPVLTQQGTVNWYRRARAIVDDEKVNRRERFIVACVFCFEESVFEIGSQMSELELAETRSNEWWNFNCVDLGDDPLVMWRNLLTKLWLEAVLERDRRCLTTQEYASGFVLALEYNNGYAVNFFANKVPLEECRYWVVFANRFSDSSHAFKYVDQRMQSLNEGGSDHREIHGKHMTCETYCLLFTKLSKMEQLVMVPQFSLFALDALLDCPKMPLFQRAAAILLPHLSTEAYWKLMWTVFTRLLSRRPNYTYLECLIALWDLGLETGQQLAEDEKIFSRVLGVIRSIAEDDAKNSKVRWNIYRALLEEFRNALGKYLE